MPITNAESDSSLTQEFKGGGLQLRIIRNWALLRPTARGRTARSATLLSMAMGSRMDISYFGDVSKMIPTSGTSRPPAIPLHERSSPRGERHQVLYGRSGEPEVHREGVVVGDHMASPWLASAFNSPSVSGSVLPAPAVGGFGGSLACDMFSPPFTPVMLMKSHRQQGGTHEKPGSRREGLVTRHAAARDGGEPGPPRPL